MGAMHKDPIGAILHVANPHGLLLIRDANLARTAFYQMIESVAGYSGAYQPRLLAWLVLKGHLYHDNTHSCLDESRFPLQRLVLIQPCIVEFTCNRVSYGSFNGTLSAVICLCIRFCL
jgi:hypothetical protein